MNVKRVMSDSWKREILTRDLDQRLLAIRKDREIRSEGISARERRIARDVDLVLERANVRARALRLARGESW